LPTVESRRLLRSEHTNLLLLLRVDADGTDVLKVPLLIVEPKQKLIPSAPDCVIPETAYDTIRTPIIFDFNGQVIARWPVRRIGALGDNTSSCCPIRPTHFLTSLKSSVLADR
jgi:hypothetical protein